MVRRKSGRKRGRKRLGEESFFFQSRLQVTLHCGVCWKKADVMLEVVDAREPNDVYRSEHLEQLVKDAGKKVLFGFE